MRRWDTNINFSYADGDSVLCHVSSLKRMLNAQKVAFLIDILYTFSFLRSLLFWSMTDRTVHLRGRQGEEFQFQLKTGNCITKRK